MSTIHYSEDPPTKRMKGGDASTDECVVLEDFPDGILVAVADFLPKTSRALFAAALTAPPLSWQKSRHPKPSRISSMIATSLKPSSPPPAYHLPSKNEGSPIPLYGPSTRREHLDNEMLHQNSGTWEIIDFEDIHHSLIWKLTDGDVFGMLVCIDAVNTVKKLKLTGCRKIKGHGLEPLRNSRFLEQIDLCPRQKYNSRIFYGREDKFPSPLSSSIIAPILYSIVEQEEHALKHVHFPTEWIKVDGGDNSNLAPLTNFFSKWEQYYSSKHLCCQYQTCSEPVPEIGFNEGREDFGRQSYLCYDCNTYFCGTCEADFCESFCDLCNKKYCKPCNPVFYCCECSGIRCLECDTINEPSPMMCYECEECEERYCADCDRIARCNVCLRARFNDCSPTLECFGSCGKRHCQECSDDSNHDVKFCSDCKISWCSVCLFKEVTLDDQLSCSKCRLRIFPKLLNEYKKGQQQDSKAKS